MGGRVSVSVVVAALMLVAQDVSAGNFLDGSQQYRAAMHAVLAGLEQIAAHATSSIGRFMVDGGGDGGGSGDGSGDGSGSGDDSGTGAGDSTSNGDSDSGDASSAADASSDQSDPAAIDPSAAPDQANVTVTQEEQSIESIPTTNPRGGFDPENSNLALPSVAHGNLDGSPRGGESVSTPGVTIPRDVAINAVIVSGTQSPWDAIGKIPGVGNVILTGGLVALGKTPIAGELPGGGPQPSWLRLVPDLKLLNGSVIPPVVPNVIDVRITRYSIEVVNKADN
jgi:hypothetical protein